MASRVTGIRLRERFVTPSQGVGKNSVFERVGETSQARLKGCRRVDPAGKAEVDLGELNIRQRLGGYRSLALNEV